MIKELKYYKKYLHKSIKNKIFRYYPHIDKDNIINGTFNESIIDQFKNDNVEFSVRCELEREVLDFMSFVEGRETERSIHQHSSRIMKDIIRKHSIFEEILLYAVDNTLTPVQNELFGILNKYENTYIVGGWVRDTIMGKQSKDMDFVCDIPYEKLELILIKNGFDVKEAGKEFLVVHTSKDGETFEISNFRSDGTYTDGRRPDSVSIGTIYDDSHRRDFTVNSLYYGCYTYTLLDPTGDGIIDLNANILKFIGKPKDRIKEDYLRIIRFYRFLQKGFIPDQHSLSACREHFKSAFAKITPERVRLELEKMAGII